MVVYFASTMPALHLDFGVEIFMIGILPSCLFFTYNLIVGQVFLPTIYIFYSNVLN